MKLIVDIGNTKTKLAVYENQRLLFRDASDGNIEKLLERALQKGTVTATILSSVKNEGDTIKQFFKQKGIPLIILNSQTPLPFKNNYRTPETLGNDRLALAAGACSLFPRQNVLVIDAGTSITYDFINSHKEYLGGSISPGIQMRFKALHTFTDKLPLIISEKNSAPPLIGETTRDAILSGVLIGILAEIEGVIDRYKRVYPNLKIILSGGDYKYFDKRLKNSIFAHSNLVLEGLLEILKFNEKK